MLEGLAVERAIHDRYHASRRNPWNEVECGDHYSRGMASYGLLISASGFECHGPKAHIGFDPRLAPENFRAPFTSAAGWGTYWQKRDAGHTACGIELRWGRLRLKTLAIALTKDVSISKATASLGKKPVAANVEVTALRALITFAESIELTPETELLLTLT